jgi:hypothetical protein
MYFNEVRGENERRGMKTLISEGDMLIWGMKKMKLKRRNQ